MNEDKQRIAIAKACGWKAPKYIPGQPIEFAPDIEDFSPPDYLNDLNAMHEAEKVMIESGADCMLYDSMLTGSFHATAAEKAEAFLKTMGLWEEKSTA